MNAQPLTMNDPIHAAYIVEELPIHATHIVEELMGYRFRCMCGASKFTSVSRQRAVHIAAEHRHELNRHSAEPAACPLAVWLHDDRELLDELGSVQLREVSPAVLVRIDDSASAHDDWMTAVALAAHALLAEPNTQPILHVMPRDCWSPNETGFDRPHASQCQACWT